MSSQRAARDDDGPVDRLVDGVAGVIGALASPRVT